VICFIIPICKLSNWPSSFKKSRVHSIIIEHNSQSYSTYKPQQFYRLFLRIGTDCNLIFLYLWLQNNIT
jgi:hypothetical protein